LDLSNNLITGTGIKIIAKMLSKIPNLQSLNLNGNNFGNLMNQSKLYYFSNKLGKNRSLQTLLMSNTKISDHDVAKISWALRSGAQITHLDLSQNNISDSGVHTLTEALKLETICLTNLNLSNNRITDIGIDATLCGNSTLTNLNLQNNCIKDEGGAEIGNMLFLNGTITFSI
jgi:Ran GTPase-activating protein (RanGAP) involved in mRNA processing and transport